MPLSVTRELNICIKELVETCTKEKDQYILKVLKRLAQYKSINTGNYEPGLSACVDLMPKLIKIFPFSVHCSRV